MMMFPRMALFERDIAAAVTAITPTEHDQTEQAEEEDHRTEELQHGLDGLREAGDEIADREKLDLIVIEVERRQV